MKKNDILTEIIANKRFEIDIQKRSIPMEQLEDNLTDLTKKCSMRESLAQSDTGIIAEFKRRSPSKGWIHQDSQVQDIIPAYSKAGASAISILTDEKYFGGTLSDVRNARPLTNTPILRKEFIVDPYQLYQAKIVGADAILLIAAALKKETCHELACKAHELGLEVLLELHTESELTYITPEIDMVGINNRNLGTFHTDINNSFHLAELLPKDMILVSESGISEPDTVVSLREKGFRGFLIGETFMKTENPGQTLQAFCEEIRSKSQAS